MSGTATATKILCTLDKTAVPQMKKNARIAKDFTDLFQQEIRRTRNPSSPLKGATILHGGSAYEGLTVDEEVDFDIIISLGKPYLAENFIVQREPNFFFSLKWKPNVANKKFCDFEDYLHVQDLREEVFDDVIDCLKNIRLYNATITYERGACAIQVCITLGTGLRISIDLVPHITFHSWAQCPDLKPMYEMPLALRRYIERLNSNRSPTFFFSLCVPWMRYDHRLCNISFALLEKRFVTSDVKVRDMVRLAKFVAYRSGWKRYSFQSYFAKRMALKHYDSLSGMDLWNGYKAILQYLLEELETNTIDGYFIANQKTLMRPERIVRLLENEIEKTLTKSPQEIEALLYSSSQPDDSSYCSIL